MKISGNRTLNQIFWIIITFATYWFLAGFKFAILLIVAVSFHEYGHLWMANKLGLKTNGFSIYPFLGGIAQLESRAESYKQQAVITLAGPVWGAVLSFITAGLYVLTHNPLWAASAYWMAFFNLFNLLPLAFLDGGQFLDSITYSINDKLGFVCRVISTTIAVPIIWKFNFIISIFLLFMGGVSLYSEYKQRQYIIYPNKLSLAQGLFAILAYGLTVYSLYFLIGQMDLVPEATLQKQFLNR